MIVIHTNESTSEVSSGAEGLAGYTAAPHPPDYPAYHVCGDNDSAVRTALDTEKVNGAGGANEDGWHYCLYGTARQSPAEWDDAYSRAELVIGAELVKQAAEGFGLPKVKISAAQFAAGAHGILGHGDVAQVESASQGHTDPGPGFPWAHFMQLVNAGAPSPADIEAYFRLLEEADVEHGMAAHTVCAAGDRLITLDRWGGLHSSNGVQFTGGGYWQGLDAARVIVLRPECVVDADAPLSGWVQDLNGGQHPFAQVGAPMPPERKTGYWKGGKLIQIAEL